MFEKNVQNFPEINLWILGAQDLRFCNLAFKFLSKHVLGSSTKNLISATLHFKNLELSR